MHWTVGMPDVWVTATCIDDDPAGCVSLEVRPCGGTVVTVTSSIDESVTLGCDGRFGILEFQATDSADHVVTDQRFVAYDSSPYLVEVLTVDGFILDVDEERVLYSQLLWPVDPDDVDVDDLWWWGPLQTLERSDWTIMTLLDEESIHGGRWSIYSWRYGDANQAHLSPFGAIFPAQPRWSGRFDHL